VLEHFTLKHPDLHANDAVGRLGFIEAVVDVGAQGVQRHATFAVPLHTSDFGAAQTARDVDADALGAQAHGRLHRTLHGAAERDTAFQLLSDVLGDQLSVGFRLADLDDVQVNFAFGAGRDVLAQLLDVSALLADHDTRTGGVDRHAALLVRTLDDNARHAGGRQAFLQPRAQLQVLVEQFGVVGAAGEPAAVPRAVHAEAQTDRIDFLTHQAASPASRTTMVISLNGFRMRDERPRARLAKRFITRFLPTKASATTRLSMSRLWLFSAFKTAEYRTLRTSPAMRLRLNSSSLRAFCTGRPRIDWATRFSFCGLIRTLTSLARASVAATRRGFLVWA